MPAPIEANIDDLTDAGCRQLVRELLPHADDPLGFDGPRDVLRDVVSCLDRASPDWPVTVLGLPTVEQLVHG